MERVKATFYLVLCFWIGVKAVDAGSVSLSTSSSPGIPCSFDIGDLRYDICPLVQSETRYLKLSMDEDTPPTRTRKTYDIGIGGALRRDGTLPADLQCPEGTWICLTVVNTRPNHRLEPSRILQVVPVAGNGTNVEEGLTPKFKVLRDEATSETSLRMTLHGGIYTGQKQKASFLFQCDRSREVAERKHGKVATPKFSWTFKGTHTFEWRSVHACPEQLSARPPDNTDDDSDEDNTLPPSDPDEDTIGDIPESLPRSISVGSYLALWLPLLALFLYIISKRLKVFPGWRIWILAQRKLSPDSSYQPVESDVGAMAEHGEFVDFQGELDEEIPLTPSPRRQTFGYGVLK
ncbi:hypothetical protein PQX77_015871 [Marasmius sp. AFHP31]|nr:hypothetical protein PQX77_015871 [Marasmius sp. AFHP31]